MCLRPALPSCETTYSRYSWLSLKYTSYTIAVINWPSENTALGSNINLSRIIKKKVATRNQIFTLSAILAKLRRKNKLFKFVLELGDSGCYRSPRARAPSVHNSSAHTNCQHLLPLHPRVPKQPVWAGCVFNPPVRHFVGFKLWSLSPLTTFG